MVRGAVFLGLITLLPAAPSSTKKTGWVRTDLHCSSPNVLPISIFIFLLFISLLCGLSSSLFFVSQSFLSLCPSLICSFFLLLSQAVLQNTHKLTLSLTHIHTALVLITRQYQLSYGLTGNGFIAGISSCHSMLFYSD